MTKKEFHEIVTECVPSYINGNISGVKAQIFAHGRFQEDIAALTLAIYEELPRKAKVAFFNTIIRAAGVE